MIFEHLVYWGIYIHGHCWKADPIV